MIDILTIVKIIASLFILYLSDYAYTNIITSDLKNQFNKINGQNQNINKVLVIQDVLSYVIVIFALYYFVLSSNNSTERKILDSGLLGLCIYGFFEMTNSAYIDAWNINTTTTHTLWGGVICAFIGFLSTIKF
jgi:uncharacterized membrane protein